MFEFIVVGEVIIDLHVLPFLVYEQAQAEKKARGA